MRGVYLLLLCGRLEMGGASRGATLTPFLSLISISLGSFHRIKCPDDNRSKATRVTFAADLRLLIAFMPVSLHECVTGNMTPC